MKLQVTDNGTQELIPNGEILRAEVTEITEKSFPRKDGGGEFVRLNFKFTVSDGEYAGRQVWGSVPAWLDPSPKCALYTWVSEILGIEPAVGFTLDTDDLVGQPCKVLVEVNEYEKDGEKRQNNRVATVLRPDGAKRQEEWQDF